MTPGVKLVAMQPVAQRDRARHRPRGKALRDNRRLLRRAPAPPPRRSRQNLNPPETVPINWQITWQTNLPASSEPGRIIRSLSAPAIWEQRLAYDPVEQGTDLRAVVDILVGQHRGDDPAGVGVRREMQHSPGPTPLGTVLLDEPFACATELQP